MLTTALHSLLMDNVESVDEDARIHIFEQLVVYLLGTQIEQLPKDDNELLGQLRAAGAAKVLLSADVNNFPDLQVLLALQSVPLTPLAERRSQQELSLGELPEFASHNELLGWTLHNHRVREDPDFPQVPIWDERADSEREHLYLISLLRKENSLDFFTHATLVKETRIFLLQDSYPSWNDVKDFQEDSLTLCEDAFDAEILKAEEGEPFRLLAARIEYLLPTFRRLPKEDKVLPYINIEVLQAADFLGLDDFFCRNVLRREMRLLIKQGLDVKSVQYECIFDLNIKYPNGKLAETWDLLSKMSQAQRGLIKSWAIGIEATDYILDQLYIREIEARSHIGSSYVSPSTPELPPDIRDSVDEGIIGFTDFNKDLPIWLPPINESKSSSGAKHDSFRISDDGGDLDDSQTSAESAQTAADDSKTKTSATNDKIPQSANLAAGLHLPAGLINSLRSTFDVTHPALVPCTRGMRGGLRVYSRPVPDWNADRVRKPAFARQKKAWGLLDVYNVEKDEEERIERMKKGLAPVWEGEKEVDYPPKRPVYEGTWVPKALFREARKEPVGWEKGMVDQRGNVEGRGGVMLPGLPVDQGVFGLAGVTVPRSGREHPVTLEHLIYRDPEY